MKRILFIGNSYTYFNDLPSLVQQLAESAGHEFEVESSTSGGKSLKWHFYNSTAVSRIENESWDFVILQDHSLQAIEEPEKFHSSITAFSDRIKGAGATPLLFMTWSRQHLPEMQDAITREYTSAAKNTSALLAPVGEAWRDALSADEDLILHTSDLTHPNLLGSYLAACVIASTITGIKPSAPGNICQSTNIVSTIAPAVLKALQQAADHATGR